MALGMLGGCSEFWFLHLKSEDKNAYHVDL